MPYSQCFERQMLTYFSDESSGGFPTFSSFAIHIGVTMSELRSWQKEHPSFAAAWEECRERQKSLLIRGALSKKYDSSTAKYLLSAMFGLGEEESAQTFSVTVEVVD